MAKFPEATARIHHGVFVCRKCKSKTRTEMRKILLHKVSCSKCGGRAFRPIKSKASK